MQSLDLEVLQHALDWTRAAHRVFLVTVTQTFGASPRPPGSLVAIRDDGILVGSVSGGCIEDDLILRRGEYSGNRPALVTYGVSNDEARRFGLPCGGTLEVIIECAVDAGRLESLLGRIASGEIVERRVDLITGEWTLAHGTPAQACTRDAAAFVCVHGPRWRMLLIGAAEISRYLAEVAATLDFQVSVCEPREEYRSAWRLAGTRWITGMPDEAVLAFRPDGHSVVLAVSHDPKLDDMALIEALNTPAFYVGAVGSRQTSADRRARLKEHFGLSDDALARLAGPVGLPIGSRTPPEIAISILADLIARRSRAPQGRHEGELIPVHALALPADSAERPLTCPT
jgi:xanthine dehydrogenase accessory factor